MSKTINVDSEELKDSFYYDETSPTFIRHVKDKWSGRNFSKLEVRKGDVAGGKYGDYMGVGYKGKMIPIHRVVMLLHGKDVNNKQVEHIDGNTLNNRISNLRVVSGAVNTRNRPIRVTNRTGVTGVSFKTANGRNYFTAFCNTLDGKNKSKNFPINKLGIMVAFRDAVACREKMIEELNKQGAGYTERHGL